MELVEILFQFFGFNVLAESATFPEFVSWFLMCACGVWIVLFIIRSLFMVIRAPELRF